MRQRLRRAGSRVASAVLSALYPSTCPVCKKPTDNIPYAPICTRCWNGIKGYTGPSCRICAVPLSSPYAGTCGDCYSHKPAFSATLCFGLYADTLREAISLLKFSGLKRLAGPLGNLMAGTDIPRTDGIVPVPLSKEALLQRGFNQTLLLARALSRHRKVPVYPNVLRKKRHTRPQIGLGARERSSNLRNAFQVVGPVAKKRLILLDDVMTTGATVRECSKMLVRAGAKEVVVVTLARSPLD